MEGIVRGVLIAGEEKIRRLKMTQSCLFEAIIFLSIFNVNFACIDAVSYMVIMLFAAAALMRFAIPEKN